MTLNAVPNAIVAESLQGLSRTDVLQVDPTDNLSQANLSNIFSNTNYPKLTSLLSGGSSSYVSTGTTTGAEIPVYTDASPPTAPVAGSIWYDSGTGTVNYYTGTATKSLVNSSTLAGDVTGTLSASVVSFVDGSSAANVHSAELLANAATNANTVSTIVKRDGSGNFNASQANLSSLVLRDTGTNTLTLNSPANYTSSYALTMPVAAPTANGQVLSSTTAGVLSWTTATSYTDSNARAAISGTSPLSYNSGTGAMSLGTVPVANGGTNSTTPLNNNRIMVSSGGAIVESGALTNGQLLTGC
jgi:hypothetical protein